jgi:hypothetical protein
VRCRASRGADTFVFTALNGGPLRPRNVTKAWSRIRKRLGLPNVPLQGLRHTQVSTLLRAGVDVFTVSRRIGHSQATTTAKPLRPSYRRRRQRSRKGARRAAEMSIGDRFAERFSANPLAWILAGLLIWAVYGNYRIGNKLTATCDALSALRQQREDEDKPLLAWQRQTVEDAEDICEERAAEDPDEGRP